MIEAIACAFFGLISGVALTAAVLKYRHAAAAVALNNAQEKLQAYERENAALRQDAQTTREASVRLEAEKAALERQILEHKEDLKKMEEVFLSKFENLSNRIFDDKSEKFKKQSQESLSELLSPLKERLVEFQKKVDESFGGQAKEQFALKEEIKRIVEVNEKMSLQAEGLTRALKGESKTQGDWGEIILERILEESGLRRDVDYIVQGAGLGLVSAQDGRQQKPDVIVNLPEAKHVIIDSKTSLTHYERFCSETADEARALHLKQFLASVRNHVAELEKRRYQDTEKLGTPDFVLMFMPIEGAYMLALQEDVDLHSFAWNKGVVIVCHSTLFATLRTIASLWRLELQNKNAQEIARQGGSLYEKIHGFVEDMQALGRQIGTVESTYKKTMTKLSEGQGNILRRTEKLKQLGAQTSKSLPRAMVAGAEGDTDDAGDETAPPYTTRQTGT